MRETFKRRTTFQLKEVATFIPLALPMSPVKSIQLNDVFVDEREIVYTADRFAGGLYILEMELSSDSFCSCSASR